MLANGQEVASGIGAGGDAALLIAALAVTSAGLLILSAWFIYTTRAQAHRLKILTRELEWESSARRAAEARLADTRNLLELRVLERTADLAQTNSALQGEVVNRIRAEETLRASEERYRELFDNANDCVFTTNLEGKFTSVNQTALSLFGYAAEDALRMNAFQLVAPEHGALVRSMLEKKLLGDESTIYEADMLTKDGRRLTFEINTRLLYAEGRPVGLQGIARDVTERKTLEEQLRQAQKMEAIGQLAGGVAHDFNNLLTIVWSYGQMMMDEVPPDSPIAEYAQEILAAAERASALTNRLLTFSRRQVLSPRVVDLNAVISGLEEMLRRLVGEHIEIETELGRGLGNVKVDPAQMEQVLLNLVVNARDAMPEGGSIRIRTKAEAAPPALTLVISDTGLGMEPAVLRRVFEPFFTTKPPGKGTGLGLSIVYGIVKQSGGQISVESSAGHGTSFQIRLPVVEESIVPVEAKPPGTTALTGRGETVLVAEDESEVRNLVTRVLREAGYAVLEGSDGAAALDIVDKHEGAIDLLLTDVIMPRIGGRELARRAARLRPETRVLYMTGYTDDEVVRQEIARAVIPVLQKPFRPDALLEAVRRRLDEPAGAMPPQAK